MRPQFSAAERLETLKGKVSGDWFRMKKLASLVENEIANARISATKLRTAGNRYVRDAEIYDDAKVAFERALKGEPIPEMYQKEFKVQLTSSGGNRHDALNTLIANNRRNQVRNRNNGGKRLQAAGEWDLFIKTLQTAFDDLTNKYREEIASHA
jgi:hypothetical protein